MKYRVAKSLLITLVLVLSSSCPSTSISTGFVAISPGVWLMTFTGGSLDGMTVATTIENGGISQIPDPVPSGAGTFNGSLTWVQNGSTFMLNQNFGGIISAYAGTVETPSRITDGLYSNAGLPRGTFVAEKL